MWGLIVSLLFLSPILDGFQALDGSGRPLPHAVLTFLRSGTTIPKPVYADQELREQLSDEHGRVTSDDQGRFPWIYLADVTAPPYRVQLHTAQGVLRWDVDPYICDCTEPPYLFRGPKHQALDPEGQPLAGARLTFTDAETDMPVRAFADAALRVPHPNPLHADAGGFFPPVYLDDSIEYRVRLTDRAGVERLDINPYVCECGFLILTSRPYPLEVLDAMTQAADALGEGVHPWWLDEMENGLAPLGGTLATPLVVYDQWPPEEMEQELTPLGGTLAEPLVVYDQWPPEEMENDLTPLGGTLVVALIEYEGYVPEEMENELTPLGGTLTAGD